MRIRALLPITCLLLCFLAGCASRLSSEDKDGVYSDLPEDIEVYYFYDEICGTCVDEDAFYTMFRETVGDVDYPCRLIPVNVAKVSGRAVYVEAMASYGHKTDDRGFPLLMIGSKLFQGDESIRKNMKEAVLVAGEDIFINGYVYNQALDQPAVNERYEINANHNTLIYFYRITCPECAQTTRVLDNLPASAEVNGLDVPVDIIRVNTRSGNNAELLRAFFSSYEVPDENQIVPIIFLKDTYLSGYDMISEQLYALIMEGRAMGFSFPE